MSPSLNIGIGMAYLPVSLTKPGTEITIAIRNKPISAKVVKLPFLKPN